MLQARRLEKIIENRSALYIELLDLNAGNIMAAVGLANSGKTLLIRLLCGMLAPSSGKVLLDGQDVHQTPAARARLGVLFQEDLLYERLSAQDNLELYCQLHKLPRGRVGEVLEQVGMSDQARKRIAKLAAPAQRRLAFARALIGHPAILLLDQPALRTDLDTQTLFARLITQAAGAGTAILLTDEDLAWAGKFCTRVVELEDGRVTGSHTHVPDQAGPSAPERLTPYKVPARKDDRILLYDPGDILYATSRDGKTYLRTAAEEATTNLTLQLNDKQETMIPLSKQSEKELQALLGY